MENDHRRNNRDNLSHEDRVKGGEHSHQGSQKHATHREKDDKGGRTK